MKENKVDIIILRYNLPKYEDQCIQSVKDTVKNVKYELTVFDNYEPDYHISKAWNKLIEKSDCEYICLLNSDTVPWNGWLKKLMEVFKRKENVGAVGPATSNTSGVQGGHEGPTGTPCVIPIDQLTGFCLIFPKKVWEEAGKFDERFHLYGEENDFLERVKLEGYNLYFRPDAFVYHYGSKTANEVASKRKDVEKLHRESRNRFRQNKKQYRKWKH